MPAESAESDTTNSTPSSVKGANKEHSKDKDKESEEKLVQTKHTAIIGGQEIAYTATAGTILLRDSDDKPTASIFYIAYTRDGFTNLANAPDYFFVSMAGPARRRCGFIWASLVRAE